MGLIESLPTAFRDLLRPHVRVAFVPEVEAGETLEPSSKIGGVPWLPEGESWPTCPNCDKAMQLLLQLDLQGLPVGARDYGRGLAQLFYCTNDEPLCEVDCEAWLPFARSVAARLVDSSKPGASAARRLVPNPVKVKRIVGWVAEEDLPQAQELRECLGVEVKFYQALDTARVPRAGDKLGGWPYWVQGVEYPACPDCEQSMQLLFQIDSNDVVGVQWGDLGCGHLTQCREHKHRLAFGWACG